MSSQEQFSSVWGWNNFTPQNPSREISQPEFAKAFSDYFQKLGRNKHALYFVTYTLSKKEEFLDGKCRESVSIRSIKPDQVFKLYDRLYRHTCSRLLGRNFHRKRAAQPIVLACLDFPYTRKRSEIRSRTDTTPHIHALYAVKVELADRFDELCDPLVQQPLMQSVDKRFRSCKIIPIRRSDVDCLSSYTTKALRYFPEHVIQQDMWTMFPRNA